MKRLVYILWVIVFALTACNQSEVKPLFDKSADERTAEAIANLKAELTAPANGFKLKYKPNDEAGSFYVFLNFDEDNGVRIRTDLAAEDGRFFDETITYRIDSSLGLELIMESYCFFSYLYDLDQATFGAEYEFNYVSKTPDNALVFVSKTDPIEPKTRLVLEQATAADLDAHWAKAVSANLSTMAKDLNVYFAPYKITYDAKDLILYMNMDDVRRTLSIWSASRKSNPASTAMVNFETSYMLDGDSIVFDTRLAGTYLGTNISLRSIKLNNFSTTTATICTDPTTLHSYTGVTSAGDAVKFESTLSDPAGGQFLAAGNFFSAPLGNINLNGEQAYQQLIDDIQGVTEFQLYYNLPIQNGTLTAMGFYLQNEGADPTFALWQFTFTRTGNKFTFNFAPGITLFGNPNPDADINKVMEYIQALTDGGNTFVFKLVDGVYEIQNPCTGWSYIAFGQTI
jgi:hypothetical protein